MNLFLRHRFQIVVKCVLLVFVLYITSLVGYAQKVSGHTGEVANGYDFWLATPEGFDAQSTTPVPLVVFLHGRSLCGGNLQRARKYGTIHAIDKGRKIDAIVLAPHNNGGAWKPEKIMNTVEWVEQHFPVDTNRVSVIGISLGGYGTLDFVDAYPDKIAAAMELCGGKSQPTYEGLSKVPLWILHGTADKAVPMSASTKVVEGIKATGDDSRLLFTKLKGLNHGGPARIFYLKEAYEWLVSHSLKDEGRPVRKDVHIDIDIIKNAYSDLHR